MTWFSIDAKVCKEVGEEYTEQMEFYGKSDVQYIS